MSDVQPVEWFCRDTGGAEFLPSLLQIARSELGADEVVAREVERVQAAHGAS